MMKTLLPPKSREPMVGTHHQFEPAKASPDSFAPPLDQAELRNEFSHGSAARTALAGASMKHMGSPLLGKLQR
jgi:hypothetical protein